VALFAGNEFSIDDRGIPDIRREQWSSQKPNHPAEKPLGLVRWLAEISGGDLTLDPFLGSGTTLVACKQLGRKGIGVEIEERYAAIAAERVRTTTPPLPFDKIQKGEEPLELPMFDGMATDTDR
jgi:DNA modification methylase